MKKIGVLTLLYNNYNYGGILQAYALVHYLCQNGYDAKCILYCGMDNVVYPTTKDKLSQYSKVEITKKMFQKIQSRINNKKIVSIVQKRKNLFLEFQKNFIPTTVVYSDKDIKKIDNEFDYFVSGSDQVWNPNCAFLPFLQGFVSDNTKKISYAASISRSKLSEYERKIMIPYIKNFQFVSVREKTAQSLLKKYGVDNVELVLDPTFLLNKEQWQSIIPLNYKKEKYVLCYFFSKSIKYRKFIQKFCNKKGYKLLYIPYAKQEYVFSDANGEGIKQYNVGPLEFLNLLNGAEYIFTDSFHGVALSLNLEKEFFVFERDKKKSSASMNSRIYDILNMFNLMDRLVNNCTDINLLAEKPIDYVKVQIIMEQKRILSKKFLENALKKTCQTTMEPNVMDTHFFNIPMKYYAAHSKKYALDSSSGGVFASLAEEFIKNNGVVYGVGYDSDFTAIYKRVTDLKELKDLYGSKYMRSKFTKSASFNTILQDLECRRCVLFVGTGCQIGALRSYLLKKDQSDEFLVTVEIICHGTPITKVWKSYIEYLQKKFHSSIKNVNFREKKYGWHSYSMCIEFENGKIYRKIMNGDPYMQMYLSGISVSKECSNCAYKSNERIGDITLGDLWGIEIEAFSKESKNGLSLVVVNNDKGDKVFNKIKEKLKIQKLLLEQQSVALSNMMGTITNVPDIQRKEFISYIENGRFKDAYAYFKRNKKVFYLKNEAKAVLKKYCYYIKNKI